MMYAILGATGNTGSAAAEALLKKGAKVRAIGRDIGKLDGLKQKGAELFEADLFDVDRLKAAFEGAEGAYLLIPPYPTTADFLAMATKASEALTKAARAAGIAHVVVLSSAGAHLASGNGVIASVTILEAALRQAGIDRTLLRPAYFMQNWAGVAPLARDQGILPSMVQPLDRRFDMVSTADIGAAVADLLLDPVKGERIINLNGPRQYSAEDAAEAFGAIIGKPVKAVAPPAESWEGILAGAGLGPSYTAGLIEMYHGLNSSTVVAEPADERRGQTELKTVLADLL